MAAARNGRHTLEVCRTVRAACMGTAPVRHHSTTRPCCAAPTPDVANVFDRASKRRQRERALVSPEVSSFDYLRDEVAARVVDRMLDISRRFSVVADVGSGSGFVGRHLTGDLAELLIECDPCMGALRRSRSEQPLHTAKKDEERPRPPRLRVAGDEEFLPLGDNTVDAVLSSMSLHWVNYLPGTLSQMRRCLKPDGVFLGAMLGGDTLMELRSALQVAETERFGGLAPHVSPFANVSDAGNLLSRAGFAITTVDIDQITINYPGPVDLMLDLKGMGEQNAAWTRAQFLRRDTLVAMEPIYRALYGNPDGSVPATFQIIYLIGWKPDPSQKKPAKRGSGTVPLASIGEGGGGASGGGQCGR
eukprot:Opistho-2@9682